MKILKQGSKKFTDLLPKKESSEEKKEEVGA